MSKILITGAAGFIGNHLVRFFLSKEFKVTGLDNYADSFRDTLPLDFHCYEGDVADHNFINFVFDTERPDYVIHCAAMASEGASHYLRRLTCQTNLTGTTNVINACVNTDVKKIIGISSMAACGGIMPPFSESDTPIPDDLYGASKYFNEMDYKFAYNHFGLNYSIVRPHNVIGIYQNIFSKTRNVIGIWIRQAMSGQNLSIFGQGNQKRAFSDVKFLLEPMHKLLFDFNGEIFNLGSDTVYSILDAAKVVQNISRKYGFNPELNFLEERKEVVDAYSDHTKAIELLGFKDETDLAETVDEMFEWAIEQPQRTVVEPKFEITKNLHSFWK